MSRIPLEDNFTDVIAKAQRGLKISDADLAARAEVSPADLAAVKGGRVIDAVIRRLARHLRLGPNALEDLAHQRWYPDTPELKHGFAMFNTGVTDLAPELNGYYGASYINADAPTTLFLVGNHFSVHQTRVIAGGQEISASEMLSRQVIKVTIPANTVAVPDISSRSDSRFTSSGIEISAGNAVVPPSAVVRASVPDTAIWPCPMPLGIALMVP